MTEEVLIPIIKCPYDLYVIDEENDAIEKSIQWGKDIGILKQDSNFDKTANACYYMRPYEFGPEKYLFLCKFILFLFTLDDIADSLSNEVEVEKMIEMFDLLKNMFTDNIAFPEQKAEDNARMNAIREISKDVHKFFDIPSLRLKRVFKHFFASMKMEIKINKKKQGWQVYEYELYRLYTVGTELALELSIPLINNAVDDSLAHLQCFYAAYESCMKITYLINDLVGLSKELKENSSCNYVICVRKETKTWQEAVNETAELLKTELKAFELSLKFIPYECVSNRGEVEAFINYWRDCIQLTFRHSYESSRYNFHLNSKIGIPTII
ncbi:hypothetical protein B4U80_12008 [Leptotrombidium deliense]|uniref:Terpene synthase n=1 Tax=Leptotrombidium deliense TaxID=299467 RepID=A0A443RZU2_9ACAR|nr:hypothetical protein B4U80_12008 [Leptotrombidium deliense]